MTQPGPDGADGPNNGRRTATADHPPPPRSPRPPTPTPYLSTFDLTPSDVLCGRGLRIQRYVGNVTFRRDMIIPRLADYAAVPTSCKTGKHRIAQEVVDAVRGEGGRGGRFLVRVTEDEDGRGGDGGDDGDVRNAPALVRGLELWREVDNDTALEKVKQTFRNENKKVTKAAAAAGMGAAAAGGSTAATAAATASGRGLGGPSNGLPGLPSSSLAACSPPLLSSSSGAGPSLVRSSTGVATAAATSPCASAAAAAVTGNARSESLLQDMPPDDDCHGALASLSVTALDVDDVDDAAPPPCVPSHGGDGVIAAPSAHEMQMEMQQPLSHTVGNAPVPPEPSKPHCSGVDHVPFPSQPQTIWPAPSAAPDDAVTGPTTPTVTTMLMPQQEAMAVPGDVDVGAANNHSRVDGAGPSLTRRDDGRGGNSVLESIGLALQLTREIRRGHEEEENNGNDKEDDLVTLGRFLYRHFAGVEPSSVGDGGEEGEEEAEESNGSSKDGPDGVVPMAVLVAGEADYSGGDVTDPSSQTRKRACENSSQYSAPDRRRSSSSHVPLRDLGLPVSLCLLVSSLMDAKDEGAPDRYVSAEQVEDDLRLMATDPDRYLFDTDAAAAVTGRARGQCGSGTTLEFPGGSGGGSRLYGRDQHMAKMMAALDRAFASGGSSPAEMVLIRGDAGTGKSALVERTRDKLSEAGGQFISGKFDELGQVQPMSVIFSAFNEYCARLCDGDEATLALVREAVDEALGPNDSVLTGVIPNLWRLLGRGSTLSPDADRQVGGKEALNRLSFYLRVFTRAIAGPLHPVVFFLDDLQWADSASLGVISMLVSDARLTSLLFVGCYRDNEIDIGHPINREMGSIVHAGVKISNIKLSNVGLASINALVSDSLRLSPRLTLSLSAVVFSKTDGNPLFAVQFLRSLRDEKLLRYSASSRRWEWDVESIRAKDIADNVVDLMTHKMQKLDPDVQWLLKIAACLGSRSEASTLKLLSSNDDDDGSDILPLFDLAVNEGLMSREGSCYKFSHDKIQQAAYSLIPLDQRDAWHVRMGRLLWKKATEKELNKIVFIVLDQLRRGSDLLSGRAEKVEVAHLCLMAGEMAMSASSFSQASICLLQGTALLEESDWEDNYNLSLDLFSLCAETQYVLGAYDGMTITLSPIFAQSRCLQDQLRAYYVFLYSLGAQGKQLDAIKCGLRVLAQLGESFPDEPNKVHVVREFAKTSAMLKDATFEDILQMNEMEDTEMIASMKVLCIISKYAYQANQPLMSLMLCRMLQLSLNHGICRETSYAFCGFGMVLCLQEKLELGFLCGKLALALLELFKAKEYQAMVYTTVYGLINMCSSPMQANLPFISYGHEVGMSVGDVEGALSAAANYVILSFQSGSKLGPLAEEASAYLQQMKQHKHKLLLMLQPCYQAILNLMDNSEDPTNLTGESMNQDELLNTALEKHLYNVTDKVYLLRIWLACLFRRHEVAAEIIEHRRKLYQTHSNQNRLEGSALTFYTGLTAIVMAHIGEAGEWRNLAFEAVEKTKILAASSSWNFQHKLDLLNAETAYYLNGDVDGAAVAYDNAIRNAAEHKFVHEQALACELAGVFHSKTSNAETAADYFEQARMHYLEWGASRKVKDVCERLMGH